MGVDMVEALFVFLVIVLIVVFISSAIGAHFRLRATAGWWAGVLLSVIFLFASSASFEKIPVSSRTVSVYKEGCGGGRYFSHKEEREGLDFSMLATQSIKLNWLALGLGLLFGFLAFEILDRIDVSDRLLSFIMLILSFSSSYSLVYVFLIRRLTYLLFSFVLGNLLSFLLHRAFFRKKLG